MVAISYLAEMTTMKFPVVKTKISSTETVVTILSKEMSTMTVSLEAMDTTRFMAFAAMSHFLENLSKIPFQAMLAMIFSLVVLVVSLLMVMLVTTTSTAMMGMII